jgi:FMN phosphatase YigB (HAD superfamily)
VVHEEVLGPVGRSTHSLFLLRLLSLYFSRNVLLFPRITFLFCYILTTSLIRPPKQFFLPSKKSRVPQHTHTHTLRWATNAVSSDVVQAVLSAWEMERHHAAERLLYPEVVNSLKKIKQEHPGVIIGAVTDGRANPRLMTFTLAPYFDFCRSWEDDQAGRTQFFIDLDSVEGNPELTWIYESARHKYATLKEARDGMYHAASADGSGGEPPIPTLIYPATYDDLVWIHVGDDLAFDVGGSATCGAKTILVELPEVMGQTARFRFPPNGQQPTWSTTSDMELQARLKMNEAAREKVDEVIYSMEQLPIAINDILSSED